jgi:hypothetical protein
MVSTIKYMRKKTSIKIKVIDGTVTVKDLIKYVNNELNRREEPHDEYTSGFFDGEEWQLNKLLKEIGAR